MTELFENERIDEVNDSISLIQKPNGLVFGTDALLLAAYSDHKEKFGLELGSGSGIISMLMLTRGKLSKAVAIDVQPEYASLTARNAELNSLSDKLEALEADVRTFNRGAIFDTVYSNPPYMKSDSGYSNRTDAKNVARHEVMGGIYDFLECAKRSLRFGGDFLAVFRPDRLTDLISAMRSANIEPKRMTFVHADKDSIPKMLLISGKLGGKEGLRMTAPLLIYRDREHLEYTDDMNYIMENGSFPEKFKGK